MEDNIVHFDKDTPKIEQANKVKSLLAVNGDDDTIGSVLFDLLVLEAGKNVGDAVKLNGLALPTMGTANKRVTVRGGAEGRIFVYPDPITFEVKNLPVGVNMVADLFWDGIEKTWSIVDEDLMPMPEGANSITENGDLPAKQKAVFSFVKDNTVDLVPSKNLFDPSKIVENSYLSSGGNQPGGSIVNGVAGWYRSGFISLPDVGQYTLSGAKERIGFAFYDENYNPTRYFAVNIGTFTSVEGEIYAAFNLKSPSTSAYSNIQFEKGSSATSYEPYAKKVVGKNSVEGLEGAIQNASVAISKSVSIEEDLENFEFEPLQSSNLLNPTKALTKTFLNASSGQLLTGTNITDQYSVTDFIPCTANEILQILNSFGGEFGVRTYCVYDSTKTFISGFSTDARTKLVTSPNNNAVAFIRFAVVGELYLNAPNQYFINEIGVFKGENNSFEYFVNGNLSNLTNDVITELKKPDSLATIKDVEFITGKSEQTNNSLKYTLAQNGLLTISNPMGSIQGMIGSQRGYVGNDMFNFYNYNILGVSASNGDDVAPIHAMNTTLGANHGYAQYLATITAHGLTNADIGREFVKGANKYYPIRIVDSNIVAFLGENLGTESNPNLVALTSGTITKEGVDYTISSVTSAQLYPSIANLSIRVIVDGNEVENGVSGFGNTIEVIEEYEIKSIDSILRNTINRAGSIESPSLDGNGFIKIQNIYRFVEGLNCLVFVRTRQLISAIFADIMATQAITLGGQNNGSTYYYVPNSNPLNAQVDLRKPTIINWSTSIPSSYIVNANQPDPQNPPNRVVQYKGNVGFMVGYLTDRGVGKNIPAYTARTFELRNNTGKVYPHPVEGSVVGTMPNVNTVFNIGMYRAFTDLSKTRIGNRLSVFELSVEQYLYAFIDYSGSMFDNIVLEKKGINGCPVELIESKNCQLASDIYNDGLYVNAEYVEGETCFIVLKIRVR